MSRSTKFAHPHPQTAVFRAKIAHYVDAHRVENVLRSGVDVVREIDDAVDDLVGGRLMNAACNIRARA
jgi:hypothetical protein